MISGKNYCIRLIFFFSELKTSIMGLIFRQRVTLMNSQSNNNPKKKDVTDSEILTFYNKATMTLLTALEVSA